jgi:alkylated DNA repair protein alkB family protein 1
VYTLFYLCQLVDWKNRAYQKSLLSEFPNDLMELVQSLANKIGYDILPESAIINFYPQNATMGGHLDDAEHALTKPIVSISYGRSAIFLIGGRQKSMEPVPILVRSGDVMIMSGESRYSYHGIPSILSRSLEAELCGYPLPAELKAETEEGKLIDTETEAVLEYLKEHRINMNVRQVKVNDDLWIEKKGTGHVKYAP